MPQIEVRAEEIEVLEQVLESYLYDLHSEIQHTDLQSFRDRLKRREAILKDFLERLESNPS